MLGHLIRKEILHLLLGRRFQILAGLSVALIVLSTLDGLAAYTQALDTYQDAQRYSDERLRQIIEAPGTILPDRYYWGEFFGFGYLVHKPPAALSIFVRGLQPIQGRTARVKSPPDQIFTRSPAAERPLLGIFPSLDLSLVVGSVLSLFVLLLTYDAVCGEKEQGTLRLAASFSIPRYEILLAKIIGAVLPTLAVLLLPCMLAAGVAVALPQVVLGSAEWLRLALILGAFCAYLTAVSCLGVAVSALVQRAATSFVLLLAIWIGSVVVVPRLSLIAADVLVGAPSAAVFESGRQAIARSYADAEMERRTKWEEGYQEENGASPWASPDGMVALYEAIKRAGEQSAPQQRDEERRLEESFQNRFDSWYELGKTLGRVSPGFALHQAVVRLAGTGIERDRRFRTVYGQYLHARDDWVRERFHKLALQKHIPEVYGALVWDVADVPRFKYTEPWPTSDMAAALVDVGLIALWGELRWPRGCC